MNDERLTAKLAKLADNTDDKTFMLAHRELNSCGLGKNGNLCKECKMMETLLTTLKDLRDKRKLPLLPD